MAVAFLLAWAVLSAAQPATAVTGTVAILPLEINETYETQALALIESDDIWVASDALRGAGLRGFSGRTRDYEGTELTSLRSLAPGISYEFDEAEVVVRVKAASAYLPRRVFTLQGQRPEGIVYAEDPGGFANYGFTLRDLDALDSFGEVGVSFDYNLFYSGLSRPAGGPLVRGLTNWTVDDRKRLRRWVAGDRFAQTGQLGGSALLGGVSVARSFDIDPYFIRYSTASLSGTVLSPSTAEVYVNGQLVRRETVEPGEFEFRNLVVPVGAGLAQLVVRDALGRETTVRYPFYFSTSVLTEGLHDFAYSAGFERRNFATESFDYGSLAGAGFHRFGVTDRFTAGGRLEASRGLASGGPTANLRLPVGEVAADAAASTEAGEKGGAGFLAYLYQGRTFGGIVSGQWLSPRYANLSLEPAEDRALFTGQAGASAQLSSDASLSARYIAANFRDRGLEQGGSVTAGYQVIENGVVTATAGRVEREAGGFFTLFAGFTYVLGTHTTAGVSYNREESRSYGQLDVQRGIPVGTGYGYRLQAQAGPDVRALDAVADYRGNYGIYQFGYTRVDDQDATRAQVAGGVAYLGGGWHPARPIQNGYALIKVPDVGGVTAYIDNQEIGETSRNGYLLLPEMLPYYGNRIRIDERDIPFDYGIGPTERVIAPPYRGGAVVDFEVKRARRFLGTVALDTPAGQVVPEFGDLSVTTPRGLVSSPIGRGGAFYLEDLPAGDVTATVTYKGRTCDFTMRIPAGEQAEVDLGALRCAGVKEGE